MEYSRIIRSIPWLLILFRRHIIHHGIDYIYKIGFRDDH